MKTGFVLEGGAMRGIYTAGVLDVFMEAGIEVDGLIGVSAGAIYGASYVSNQPGRSIRYVLKHCRNWRFMSFRSLLFTGDMVGRRFCYEEIPYRLDPLDFEAFRKSKVEFYACATNVETGKAEYLSEREERRMLTAVLASASMPMVSRIVEFDGKKYLDGGVGDSIPFEAFRKLGYDRQIVVTTQPKGYRKEPEKLMELIRRKYRKYPAFIESCRNRYLNYNACLERLAEAEKKGEALVIRPSRRIPIKRAEKDLAVVQAQYDLGREDALKRIEEVRAFLVS